MPKRRSHLSGGAFTRNYKIRPGSTLDRFHASGARIRYLVGPWRSGKSVACVMELVRRAKEQAPGPDGVRRSRWAIIRNHYTELKSTTLQTFIQWFPPGRYGELKMDLPITYIMRFDDVEAEFVFLALNRDEDLVKLQSFEVTGAWVNEGRFVPRAIIDDLAGRTGQYPDKQMGGATWRGVIVDTNPPDEDHWLPDLEKQVEAWREAAAKGEPPPKPEEDATAAFMPASEPNEEDPITSPVSFNPDLYEFFHQPSGLSPEAENTENLPENYYLETAQQHAHDPEWIRVYMHGKYGGVAGTRVVYPNFRASRDVGGVLLPWHVSAVELEPMPGLPIYLGWDFGLCYDDQTEVLTAAGWKFFKDVDEHSERVATRNPASGALEYTPINFKVDRPYEGEMLEWANTEINFCVTPEHRVPFTYRDSPRKVHFAEARWLADHMGGHHYVDVVSDWSAPDFDPANRYFGMDAQTFAEFMGLYLSEGSVGKGYDKRITIYQKERRVDWERILTRTGLEWRWFDHGKSCGWRANAPSLAPWLRKKGGAREKRVPDSIKAMPRSLIRNFIAAYTSGDGHVRTRPNGSEEHTVYTVSRDMANDFQELAQKAGWNAAIRHVAPQASMIAEGNGARTILNDGGFSISFKKRARRAELHRRNFRRIQYSGRIYCLNVPYHTLYVRRGGKAHWNGNTPACIIAQLHPQPRQLRVLQEIIGTNINVRDFIRSTVRWWLENKYRGYQIVSTGDPSGGYRGQETGETCLQILRQEGFPTDAAETNDPTLRIDAVEAYLNWAPAGQPAFLLDPRCRVLIQGFKRGYRWKRKKKEGQTVYVDVIDKDGNIFTHPHDALQYLCLGIQKAGRVARATAHIGQNMKQRLAPVVP